VKHKERMKQMRTEVHVLSMTATPIPRTLHMALSGVRDISVIETPPEDRQPIETHVVERTDDVLREAILRELDRGGQVFFVIDRAGQLGLAQLYQLRGRVGRSAAKAYAYLLHEKQERLTDDARKRLQAVFEASELGAGFKIAMHDLEIRGAGNILGAEQHGHVAAVGFELYTQLLEEAVNEQRGAPRAAALPEITIDLALSTAIPD